MLLMGLRSDNQAVKEVRRDFGDFRFHGFLYVALDVLDPLRGIPALASTMVIRASSLPIKFRLDMCRNPQIPY